MNRLIAAKLRSFLVRLLPGLSEDLKLAQYTRDWVLPVKPTRPDLARNVPEGLLGTVGIDFHAEEQLTRIASYRSDQHKALFEALRSDRAINRFGSARRPSVTGNWPASLPRLASCRRPSAEDWPRSGSSTASG
jgi:hypothetical protein